MGPDRPVPMSSYCRLRWPLRLCVRLLLTTTDDSSNAILGASNCQSSLGWPLGNHGRRSSPWGVGLLVTLQDAGPTILADHHIGIAVCLANCLRNADSLTGAPLGLAFIPAPLPDCEKDRLFPLPWLTLYLPPPSWVQLSAARGSLLASPLAPFASGGSQMRSRPSARGQETPSCSAPGQAFPLAAA